MSNNLNLPQVAAAQNQKEVTINQTSGLVDAAVTENLAVSMTAGNVTLTAAQYQQSVHFNCSGHTAARVLTVPATLKRLFVVSNNGTGDLTVTLGASTVVISSGNAGLIYSDGAALKSVASGGGSGGASSFVELVDTFSTYAGRSGELVRVNGSETGLESVNPASVLPFSGQTWAVPWRGAVVQRTTDQTVGAFPARVNWNSSIIDTDGFYSAGSPTRLTIPAGAGIKKIRLVGSVQISESSTAAGAVLVQLWKNGVSTNLVQAGHLVREGSVGFTGIRLPVSTPVFNVADGDYFEINVQISGLNATGFTGGVYTFMSVEVAEAEADLIPLNDAPSNGNSYGRKDGAWAQVVPYTEKGANNGVATLDATGKIPTTQLPPLAINDTFVVASEAAMLALDAQRGDVAVRTDVNKSFILSAEPATTLANWVELLAADGVQSVGLSLPTNEFNISGSPVTGTGTLTGTWKTQGPNVVFAGPGSGSAAVPNFRALVGADLPLATPSVRGAIIEPASSPGFIWARAYASGVGSWAQLGSAALVSAEGLPFVNLMRDSGRFCLCLPGQNLLSPATFSVDQDFFASYNGSSFASVGQFIHNNTTNGGTAGNLTQPVIDLLAAMGRVGGNARYGAEFFICETTAGSGTGAAGPVDPTDGASYLMLIQNSVVAANFQKSLTFVGWVTASAGTIFVNGQTGLSVWINGVLQPSGWITLKPADGWKHLRITGANDLGYVTSTPGFYATAGGKMQMAVPAFFNGIVNPGVHTAPLRGFDSAIVRNTLSGQNEMRSFKTGNTLFDGPVVLPTGSASNCAVALASTPGTGFYGNSTTIVATTVAVPRMLVAASGVVLQNSVPLQWGSSGTSTPDVGFARTAANVITATCSAGLSSTGPFSAPAGSAAATSYNFGTAGTGMYGSSSNVFFATSGTARFGVQSATDFRLQAAMALGWGSSFGAAADVQISRTAANTFAINATSGVSVNGPFTPSPYTVATVPAASSYNGAIIHVSDATGGASPAYSNGTNWISLLTGTNI